LAVLDGNFRSPQSFGEWNARHAVLELPGKIPDALAINSDVGTNGRSKTSLTTLRLIPPTGLIAA
jgi:hypothetical protein